jgi:DNA-binding MarR family transcriptional regulator
VSDFQNDAFEKMFQTDYNTRILVSLRRIIRAIDQYSRKLRSVHDITGPQLICLLHIVNEKPHTISQISKSVSLSDSTVVGIIDRLENKGLVYRERNNNDRRQVKVIATEKGLDLTKRAPSPLQDRLSESMKNQTELEQAAIALSLEKIVEMMELRHIDASPILETDTIIQSIDLEKSSE